MYDFSLEKLSSKVDFIFGFPFPSDSFNYDKGHPVVKIGNVKSGATDTLVNHEWVEKAKVVKGDIIFGMSGDFNISKWKSTDALLNQRTCAIRNKTQDDYVSFLFYALEQPLKELNNTTQATMIKNLSAQQLRSLKVLMPDAITAGKIAAFLDARTAKIDSLSDELTKFKANLQLQKRSLVSECVTKGIPTERDRVYKNSGVEWLGYIPAGWEVSKLKNVFSERREKSKDNAIHLTPSQKYGTLPQTEYIKISGSKPVLVLSENATFKQVYKNDFISHLRSFQGGLEITNYDGKISPAYTVITPDSSYEPRYLKHMFKGVRFIELLTTTTAQMRDGQAIKWKQLSNLELPTPPVDEQIIISNYLDEEFMRIDALIGEIDNQVNLLKTYRKSLIDEVVTGKVAV